MPIPVPIPAGSFLIDDAISAKAEALVAAIAQIVKNGTSGAALNTPPTLSPVGPNPAIDPTTGLPYLKAQTLATPEQQLYHRQLAVALVSVLGTSGGSATVVPRLVLFSATCDAALEVGSLVCVTGDGAVGLVDVLDATKLPAIGCIIEKPTSLSCTVQTHGIVSGMYAGLQPGRTYCVGVDGRPSLQLSPEVGQAMFYQAIGMALDPTSLVLSPSIVTTRIVG